MQIKKWPCESECTAGPYRHTNSCIPTCWQRPMRESQRVSEGCHVVLYTVSFYQNASRLNHVNVRRVADQQYDSLRGVERMPYHRNVNMSSGTSTDQATGPRDSTVLTLSNYRNASPSSEGVDVKVCAVAFIAANSLLSRMTRANSSAYFGNWAVVEVDFNDYPDSTLVSLGNPRKVSRLPKISPGLFFASTVHHALYIDSKLEFIDDPLTMMGFKDRKTMDRKTGKRVNVTAAFMAVRHELSRTIYEEGERTDSNTTLMLDIMLILLPFIRCMMTVEAIFKVRRDFSRSVTYYPYELRQQVKHYRKLGRQLNMSYVNVFEGAVLLHNLKSIPGYHFRCMWYREYLLWADRDQISGGFALANSARIVRNTSSSTLESRNETIKDWIPIGRDPLTNVMEYAHLLLPYHYYWGPAYHARRQFVQIHAGSWHDNHYVPIDHAVKGADI